MVIAVDAENAFDFDQIEVHGVRLPPIGLAPEPEEC